METRATGWSSSSLSCALALLAFFTMSDLLPGFSTLVDLRNETRRAFDAYVASSDARNNKDFTGPNFLWIDSTGNADAADAYAKLKGGEILMRQISGARGNLDVPAGLIHDWQGLVFIPGVKLDQVLQVLQDYDHQSTYFSPDVEKSKIEVHDGDHFRVYLRFKRKKIVTLVLNTEHDITYFRDSSTRAHSRSSAIRISEVDNPGEPSEKEKTPGQDNGFLWRMETWWRMEEKDGGVYVQNQVVSLTRDIPIGLGWAVEPFVTSIPKESLEFTLGAVRRAVLTKAKATRDSQYPRILSFESQSKPATLK
jgi:hypothetical protein